MRRNVVPIAAVVLAVLPAVGGFSCGGGGGGSDPANEPPYAPGWSAVHADGANTDYSPVEGASDLTLAWERHFEGSIRIGPLPWTINLGATIDPEGRVYLTTTVEGCHLQAIDGASGETLWCSTDVDLFAVASSPVIDREGRLFLADGEAWSSSALALATGESQRTVQRALDDLADKGKVQAIGSGRARRWMAPPLPGFPSTLLLPPALPGS